MIPIEIRRFRDSNYFCSASGGVYCSQRGILHPVKPIMNNCGYLRISIHNLSYFFAHRMIVETWIGEIPPGLQVDHINGKRTDNRAENLRIVPRKVNHDATHVPHKNKLVYLVGETMVRQKTSMNRLFLTGIISPSFFNHTRSQQPLPPFFVGKDNQLYYFFKPPG